MNALSEMDARNAFDYAQAHLIVGVNFLVSSDVTTATRYIKYAANLIEGSPSNFLPPPNGTPRTPNPLEPSCSEEVQERFALIAHIVNCRCLLRIHALEKKIKTVLADVIQDLPVRIVQTYTPLHRLFTPGSQAPVAYGVLDVLNGAPNGALASLDSFFSVEFWVRPPFLSHRWPLIPYCLGSEQFGV